LGIRAREELDAIDLKILSGLQQDGRMANNDLARRVGLSPTHCLRRVRALKDAGFIKGYRALLDERLIGLEITSFVTVELASQAEASLAAFELAVRDLPNVCECSLVSGGADYVLKCVARSVSDLETLLRHFASLPNVRNVRSLLALRNTKNAPLPLGEAPDHTAVVSTL
jgi:DNA-binding Lrp family transcriptional regulator